MIELVTPDGQPLEVGLASLFGQLKGELDSRSGVHIAKGVQASIRWHFASKWPGSQHYDPSKVGVSNESGANVGVVGIDVPGVSRAYHDIDILPVAKKHLTIPMHAEAYGKKATDFEDLFVVKKKDGKLFLAKHNGGDLQMMYFLANSVHQKQDPGILPSDQTLARHAISSVQRAIDNFDINQV